MVKPFLVRHEETIHRCDGFDGFLRALCNNGNWSIGLSHGSEDDCICIHSAFMFELVHSQSFWQLWHMFIYIIHRFASAFSRKGKWVPEDEIQRLVSEACQKVVEEQAVGFDRNVFANQCVPNRVSYCTVHGFAQEVKFKELQDKFQDGLNLGIQIEMKRWHFV